MTRAGHEIDRRRTRDGHRRGGRESRLERRNGSRIESDGKTGSLRAKAPSCSETRSRQMSRRNSDREFISAPRSASGTKIRNFPRDKNAVSCVCRSSPSALPSHPARKDTISSTFFLVVSVRGLIPRMINRGHLFEPCLLPSVFLPRPSPSLATRKFSSPTRAKTPSFVGSCARI